MKTIAFLGIFFSSSLIACPNINGTFKCKIKGGLFPDFVETWSFQAPNSYTRTKNEMEVNLVADGQIYKVEDQGGMRNLSYTASCLGDGVAMKMEGVFYRGNLALGAFESNSDISYDGTEVTIESKNVIAGISQRMSTVCTAQ